MVVRNSESSLKLERNTEGNMVSLGKHSSCAPEPNSWSVWGSEKSPLTGNALIPFRPKPRDRLPLKETEVNPSMPRASRSQSDEQERHDTSSTCQPMPEAMLATPPKVRRNLCSANQLAGCLVDKEFDAQTSELLSPPKGKLPSPTRRIKALVTRQEVLKFYGIILELSADPIDAVAMGRLHDAMACHWWELAYGRAAIAEAGCERGEIVRIGGQKPKWLNQMGRYLSSNDILRDAHVHNVKAKDDTSNRLLSHCLDQCSTDGERMKIVLLANLYNGHGFTEAVRLMREIHPEWYSELVHHSSIHGLAAIAYWYRIQLFSARHRPNSISRFITNKGMRGGFKKRKAWFLPIAAASKRLPSFAHAQKLLQKLRKGSSAMTRYRHVCSALGLPLKSQGGHDALMSKNLLQRLSAVGLIVNAGRIEKYPQCVGSTPCQQIAALEPKVWVKLLEAHHPGSVAIEILNVNTGNITAVKICVPVQSECVHFWNCMYGRCLNVLLHHRILPDPLKRNRDLHAQDAWCGRKNPDMTSAEDLYKFFKSMGTEVAAIRRK